MSYASITSAQRAAIVRAVRAVARPVSPWN